MNDPDPTVWPAAAWIDRLFSRRAVVLAWILGVLVSPALWWTLRPYLTTREFEAEMASTSPLSSRWRLEWSASSDEPPNGVWIDLADRGVGDQALEFRPSGRCSDPARSDFGFHIYEVYSASWAIRRADLKAALAAFQADPAAQRARGWDFEGRWIAGVPTSGIIYTGTSPGRVRVPIPARAAAEGITVYSEKVPVGGAVEMTYLGTTTPLDAHAPAWQEFLIRPPGVVSAGTTATFTARIPPSRIDRIALSPDDGEAPHDALHKAELRTRLLGVWERAQPLEPGRWEWAVPFLPVGGHVAGVGLVVGLVSALALIALGAVSLPWPRLAAAMAGVRTPIAGLFTALGRRLRAVAAVIVPPTAAGAITPFRFCLAITLAVHAWFASWAPLLYLPDGVEYVYNAHRLFGTGRFDHFNAWRMPGTSFMLLPWIALSDRPEELAGWAQALYGVLIACMTYDILRRFVPRGWAALGMLLVGIDPVGLLWERHLITETPTAILATAVVWMLVRLDASARVDRGAWRWLLWAAGIGLAGALATYVRGNAVLLVLLAPLILLVSLWSPGRRGRAVVLAAIAALSAGAAMAPWMLRNQREYGRTSMIIGRGFARLIFAWYGGQIDVNQTRLFGWDDWKSAAARQAGGANEFDFMLQLDASPRLAGPAGEHPWVQRDRRCAIAADESRARRPADAAILAGKALLSHLHLWQDPTQQSFRNTDYYSQPHRGVLYGSSSLNWPRAPSEMTFGEKDRMETLADRTVRDIRWVTDSPSAAAFGAWYFGFDRLRPALGVLCVLGGLLSLREPRRILWIVPLSWFGNALAFSWVFLNGETRYSEPLYALAIIAGVFGLCRACQGLGAWLRPGGTAPARE